MADEVQGAKISAEDWVVVYRRAGHDADIEADLVVSLLEGSNIPVVRIPLSSAPVVFDGFGGPLMPVQVLVPPDQVENARQLLADSEIEYEGFAPERKEQ